MRKDDTHAMWPGPLMVIPNGDYVSNVVEGSVNVNPISGFGGDPIGTHQWFNLFGNMVTVTYNLGSVTLAPGVCTANIALPVPLLTPFDSVSRASGAAAGLQFSDGAMVSGEIVPVLGTSLLLLTLNNPSPSPVTPDYGLQMGFTYKLN